MTLNVTSVRDAQGNILHSRSVWRDITARKEAEAARLESEQQSRILVENSPYCIHQLNPEGCLISMNFAGLQMLCVKEEREIVGRRYLDLIGEEDRARIEELFNLALKGESAEFEFQGSDGHNYQSSFVPIRDHMEKVARVMGLSQDITERKRSYKEINEAHVQLRALARQVTVSQEEERKRIARELHDEFGQTLAGLKFALVQLDKQLCQDLSSKSSVAYHTQLTSITKTVDAAIFSMRKIATELRPSLLDDLGLVAALEWQVQEFQSRTSIPCALTMSAGVRKLDIDSERALAIFRITQELLTNVLKHAGATMVNIVLTQVDDILALKVKDNGRGITQLESVQTTSMGLLGIRERLAVINGEVNIQGEPENGTEVAILIPLHPAATGVARGGL